MDNSVTRQLRLADGRVLSYSDTGTGQGGTWVHCHGIPGSRYELAHLSEPLAAAGLRVVVADRPGYGGSTPCPGYDFAQHTNDVRQLADNLGLERFSVSGFSGGGVFALALSHDLGDRVKQLAIAATPAVPLMANPFEHASELTAGSWQAALADPENLAYELESLTQSEDLLYEAMLGAMGPADIRQLTSDSHLWTFRKSLQTAIAQGSKDAAMALARDSRLMVLPWRFNLQKPPQPDHVFHGDEDLLVHEPHFRALVHHLQPIRSELVAGAGHYGVLARLFQL
ncbi:alpha/beta fold hydrolase [Marinobacter confluentis]|uniref:Alpha/beta hydrolase n=1 Tax=Marinobacter confluentis TaxID=1697557 RepID=A0A4Z1C2Z9_9GAMM|nr:alpha/beta hydrolase [Marinobacter confluentis]TGN40521.1 alpha/beta hydrolase [Marinobacter confluentis]